MKKYIKYKTLQVTMWVGGWLSLLAPIGIYFYKNKDFYFKTVENSLKIGIGAIIGITLIVLLSIGKAKFGALLWFVIGYGLLGLLKPILGDLQVILLIIGCGFAGDKYVFKPLTIYFKKLSDMTLSSNINAKAMGNVFVPQEIEVKKRGRV